MQSITLETILVQEQFHPIRDVLVQKLTEMDKLFLVWAVPKAKFRIDTWNGLLLRAMNMDAPYRILVKLWNDFRPTKGGKESFITGFCMSRWSMVPKFNTTAYERNSLFSVCKFTWTHICQFLIESQQEPPQEAFITWIQTLINAGCGWNGFSRLLHCLHTCRHFTKSPSKLHVPVEYYGIALTRHNLPLAHDIFQFANAHDQEQCKRGARYYWIVLISKYPEFSWQPQHTLPWLMQLLQDIGPCDLDFFVSLTLYFYHATLRTQLFSVQEDIGQCMCNLYDSIPNEYAMKEYKMQSIQNRLKLLKSRTPTLFDDYYFEFLKRYVPDWSNLLK